LATFYYFKDVELVETTEAGPGTGSLRKFTVKSLVTYQPPKGDGNASVKEEKKG
jgi:hypothetical protein